MSFSKKFQKYCNLKTFLKYIYNQLSLLKKLMEKSIGDHFLLSFYIAQANFFISFLIIDNLNNLRDNPTNKMNYEVF